MWELWLMFSGAFLAATLLPGGSEVLLLALLDKQPEMALSLLLSATIGNTLGALSSYLLGLLGHKAVTPEQLDSGRHKQALALLKRYGYWALLLSWVPLIGDILCLLAGWMKLPLTKSTLMILTGKGLRYLIIVLLALEWLQ